MPKVSAGLLLYRFREAKLQFLLVHPGGPFWRNKDAGAWSIPKGELMPGEEPLTAAKREFEEELGLKPEGRFIELTTIEQKGGKTVHAWAVEGEFDPGTLKSNYFSVEWPPRSGRQQQFPEIDRAEWFDHAHAKSKINPAQLPWLQSLEQILRKSQRRTQ